MIYILLLTAIITKNARTKKFDWNDFEDFRELIIAEIQEEQSGLTPDHPMVGPFDGLRVGDQPLIASLIRLAFHDCSGFGSGKYGNTYACDGCIKLSHPDHKGLKEGGIDPIEDICSEFDGLSRADCWALAATIAVEVSANNTLTQSIRAPFYLNPTVVDILPGDIPYYIGRKDCDTSPDTSESDSFVPFAATDAWEEISPDMKNRFGLSTNQEVVALIGGGHSVGRGHMAISSTTSGWDISPDVVDNDYFLSLINREPVAEIIGLNLDFFQGRVIDYDLDDELIAMNGGQRTGRQFTVNIPPYIGAIFLDIPRPRDFKWLNIDISLAFNISKYISNGNENNITCHTDAYSLNYLRYAYIPDPSNPSGPPIQVPDIGPCYGKQILIAGYEPDIIPVDACDIRQCPLQCEDGAGGFGRFNQILQNEELMNEGPDTDCIRALVEQFANDNKLFTTVFVEAFTKMITTGDKHNGKIKLKQLTPSKNKAVSISMEPSELALYSSLMIIGMLTLFCLCIWAYVFISKRNTQALSDKEKMLNASLSAVESNSPVASDMPDIGPTFTDGKSQEDASTIAEIEL